MADGLGNRVDSGDPRGGSSRERWGIGATGLLLIVFAVCVITLTPAPVDRGYSALVEELLAYLHDRGVPAWFGYRKLEFSANILMFVPVGFFVGLLLPLRRAWIGGFAGMSFSVLVEVLQYLVLPERFASVLDVLANTMGGWIGIGVAVLTRLAIRNRDRRLLVEARRGEVGVGTAPTAAPR